MTKQELIKELHAHGELWANDAYTKEELQNYLNGLLDAQNMDLSQLAQCALRFGFCVTWKVGKNKKEECFETMRKAQDKKNELILKGYKGIKITQCIY